MSMRIIAPGIAYIPACDEPLSAEIAVISGKTHTWLFDVGQGTAAQAAIATIQTPKNVILSHFHPDHLANYALVTYDQLYVSRHTYGYTQSGVVVKEDLIIEDGVQLHLFELPSSHAKGSLGLEVNGTYAFLGDGVYSMKKNGRIAYNANLLKAEIAVLRGLEASYFVLSHDFAHVYPKAEVLDMLEKIYLMRNRQEAFIYLAA